MKMKSSIAEAAPNKNALEMELAGKAKVDGSRRPYYFFLALHGPMVDGGHLAPLEILIII